MPEPIIIKSYCKSCKAICDFEWRWDIGPAICPPHKADHADCDGGPLYSPEYAPGLIVHARHRNESHYHYKEIVVPRRT